MDLGLNGKIALVSGASRGIGNRIALAFAEEGARLCICARNQEGLEKAKVEIEALGAEVEAVVADLSEASAGKRFVEAAVSRFGGVDILINNAGIAIVKPMLDWEEEDWDRVVDTNLKGAWLMAQAAARRMLAGGGASGDGKGRWRKHRQHLLHFRAGVGGARILQRGQGGDDQHDRQPGARGGPQEYPRQFRGPGIHPLSRRQLGEAPAGGSRGDRSVRQGQYSQRPLRQAGGSGRRGCLSGVGQGQLGYRKLLECRWRSVKVEYMSSQCRWPGTSRQSRLTQVDKWWALSQQLRGELAIVGVEVPDSFAVGTRRAGRSVDGSAPTDPSRPSQPVAGRSSRHAELGGALGTGRGPDSGAVRALGGDEEEVRGAMAKSAKAAP